MQEKDEIMKPTWKKTQKLKPNLNHTLREQNKNLQELQLQLHKTKPGEIILLNEDGRKWTSYLKMTGREGGRNEWFYLRGGLREMCKANGVKVNDSL